MGCIMTMKKMLIMHQNIQGSQNLTLKSWEEV